jgi:hypothetical protein
MQGEREIIFLEFQSEKLVNNVRGRAEKNNSIRSQNYEVFVECKTLHEKGITIFGSE